MTPATPVDVGEAVPVRLDVPATAATELWDSGLPVAAHERDTLDQARHCGRHLTPSSDSAMRRATETSIGSAPSAAALRSFATTRHDALSRQYAGKCCSISSRTSASVISFMTSGMTSGRGSGRDQFGLGRGHSYATQTPARPENRPNRPGGRATDRWFRPIPFGYSASSRVSSKPPRPTYI
jgi:hypothetical protein